ncbi:MAG: nickel-dependent hydrogenase large subunit [Candidatus Micrarchaeota archaeon]|nr:nickel-dependent hydrogenase large subunit [Candidatus Micrarchaeota archaeon]
MHRFEDVEGAGGNSVEHIHVDNMSKVEGHGKLDIKVKNGKVEYAKLKITESKRFYTQAIRNKFALSLPLMTSRICGTCSIAHLTCCSEAVERALDYTPSDQTLLLRKLSLYGMMIRDHALHLFMFCLPDLFGKDSVLDLGEEHDDLVKKAFAIKSAGNELSKAIAGRAVHATFAEVGKFSHLPDPDTVKKVIAELKVARDYAIEAIELFYNWNASLELDSDFVALATKDYSFFRGNIVDSNGLHTSEDRYWDYLERIVMPYSEATSYKFEGREYMVGALARMNLNRDALHVDTRKDAAKYLSAFPSKNIYHNNLAQAIEILHSIDHSIEILESSQFTQEQHEPLCIKEGDGVGLIEAPRGTLYYMVSIDKTGKVTYGNIIVPTQQNQMIMERSTAKLVQNNLSMDRHMLEHEIEKLIRAYDPCMSCASHFLKVNWR